MNKNRIVYMDILRIFATISVIMLHVTSDPWTRIGKPSIEWSVINIYECTAGKGVPIFIMLSGALFLNPNKDIRIKDIFLKYIMRIGVAYAAWSLVYNIQSNIIYYSDNYSMNTLRLIVIGIIRGHYHLTFLFVIAGLYIVTPVLRKVVIDRNIMRYFLACSFIFVILPTLMEFDYPLVEFKYFFDEMQLGMLGIFVGYFVLGYYLNTTEFSKKARYCIYAVAIVLQVVVIVFTNINFIKEGETSTDLLTYGLPMTYIFAVAIFLFFKYEISRIKFSENTVKIITHISSLTFGIYLAHDLIRGVVIGVMRDTITPVVTVPISTVIVVVVSYLISLVISKIPIVNKYLI